MLNLNFFHVREFLPVHFFEIECFRVREFLPVHFFEIEFILSVTVCYPLILLIIDFIVT